MSINNLLLKQSKGTIFEDLARSVAMQQFQNVNSNYLDTTNMSKGTIFALLLFMIILLVVGTYVIPYCIYEFMKGYTRHDMSLGYAVVIFTVIGILSYITYVLPYIILILIFIIALLIALFN